MVAERKIDQVGRRHAGRRRKQQVQDDPVQSHTGSRMSVRLSGRPRRRTLIRAVLLGLHTLFQMRLIRGCLTTGACLQLVNGASVDSRKLNQCFKLTLSLSLGICVIRRFHQVQMHNEVMLLSSPK